MTNQNGIIMKIELEENLRFMREMQVVTPAEMTMEDSEGLINNLDIQSHSVDDFIWNLKEFGFEIVECPDHSTGSPEEEWFECTDYSFIKEVEYLDKRGGNSHV